MGIFSMNGNQGGGQDGSLFRTTANTQFNSFNNPISTLHMQGDGWGIDPSYLTPNYAAPYRPGSQEAAINSPRPGFFHSVNQSFNPAASPIGRFQDPYASMQPFYESMGHRPVDAMMTGAQFAGAAGAWYVAQKAIQTLNYGSTARAAASSYKVGRTAMMGNAMFGGAARGLMGAGLASTSIGSGAIGAAGWMGGLAGGIAGGIMAPAALAGAGIWGLNQTIFNPYSDIRNTGRDLRENLSGITLGGGQYGNPSTGRGLSARASNQMGADIMRGAARNFSFSNKEISGIADLAARSGLLDNVDPEKFAKQITSITKQVATIAAVANDPDFRNSIEIMARLKDAGLDVNKAGSFMSKLGGFSSVAGVSTRKMMELGQQSQFLFGANGINPYLGQQQFAQTYASFAAGKRSGVVSNELLSRLGGEEGAAQLSVSGQLAGAQTMYNQILNTNRFFGGKGGTGNISSNLSNFGSMFSANPFEVMGGMGLHQGRMISEQMKSPTGGIMATQNQIMDLARSLGMTKGGKITDAQTYQLATSLGLNEQEARAHVANLGSVSSKAGLDNILGGLRSNFVGQVANAKEQSGAAGMIPIAWGRTRLKEIGAGFQETANSRLAAISNFGAAITDDVGDFLNQANYGNLRGLSESGKFKVSNVDKVHYKTRRERMDELMQKGFFERDHLQIAGLSVGNLRNKVTSFLGLTDDDDKQAKDYWNEYLSSFTKPFTGEDGSIDYNNLGRGIRSLASGDVTAGDAQKIMKSLGTRDHKEIMPVLKSISEELNGKYAGNFGMMLRDRGMTPQQLIESEAKKQNIDVSLLGIKGDYHSNAVGNQTAIEQYRTARDALQENTQGYIDLYNKGGMTTGEFTTMLNRTAAETTYQAADLMYRAASLLAGHAEDETGEKIQTPLLITPGSSGGERVIGGSSK